MESKNQLLQNIQELSEKKLIIEDLIKNTCVGVQTGSVLLLEIVESLKTSLTSSTPSDRCIGTKFLADIIQFTSSDKLNTQELSFLATFFSDRLNDHHTTLPSVLQGLLLLIKTENIADEDVQRILQSLFRDTHCQSFPMADRRIIFTIIQYCLFHKLSIVKGMGTSFIVGFISSMDGEKDPRNLVLLFSFFPFVAQNLCFDAFTEDLFEVVAAYFPIDFVPPTQDPYGVSSNDLVSGLRLCLAATDSFATFCLPLLQEKLESDLLPAKLDSLRTLTACCDSYSPASLRTYLIPLWECVRREIVENSNVLVEKEALTALTAVVSRIERGPSDQDVLDSLNKMAYRALDECLRHLAAPETRLIYTSADLLLAIADPSASLAKVICKKVFPVLCGVSTKEGKTAHKNVILVLTKFMKIAQKFDIFNDVEVAEQMSCYDVLYEGFSSADASVVEAAASSVSEAVAALTEPQLTETADRAIALLKKSPTAGLRKSLTGVLVACEGHPVISNHILPTLIKQLTPSNIDDVTNAELLDVIPLLVTGVDSLRFVIPPLWSRAEELMVRGQHQTSLLYIKCIRKSVSANRRDARCLQYLSREWRGITSSLRLLLLHCLSEPPTPPSTPPVATVVIEELTFICQEIVNGEDEAVVECLVCTLAGLTFESRPPDAELLACVELIDRIHGPGSGGDLSDTTKEYLVYAIGGLILSQGSVFKYSSLKEVVFDRLTQWSLNSSSS